MSTLTTLPQNYSQHYIGDTGNPLTVQFIHADLSIYSLIGVNKSLMTFRMKNMTNGAVRSGVGAWTTVSDANGIAAFAWDALDVAVAGVHQIQTTIIFAAGPITFRPLEIEFIARI